MSTAIMDAWEPVITAGAERAVTEWAALALDAVLPDLTADTGGMEPRPDPEALLALTAAWVEMFETEVAEPLLVLMAARVAQQTSARGVALPAVDASGEIRAALADLIAESAELRTLLNTMATVDQIETVLAMPTWQAFQADYLAAVSNRVVGMPDDVFRLLSNDLAKGIEAGEGWFDLSVRVRGYLDQTAEGGFEALYDRAVRIARTETTGAVNASTLEAARLEAELLGIELHKVWVSTMDPRTRPEHFAADGQRVPLDGEFEIGDARLAFPGDPNGPASQVVNCRCALVMLEPAEPLPGETDRQTERQRSTGHTRDPFAEVIRRAEAEGVTRAREDPSGVGIVAATEQENTMPDTKTEARRAWTGVLAPIGVPTGDGRIFTTDIELAYREFPLPLMWQRATDHGHDQAVIVGRIDTARIDGGQVVADGVMFDTPDAAEAAQLLDDEVVRPSVDLCDVQWAIALPDGTLLDETEAEAAWERGDDLLEATTAATIMGATLVAKPAFAEAKISLTAGAAADGPGPDMLVASSAPWEGHADWFADPGLDRLTPLTVTEDGRVFGHLAGWDTCHVGIRDACVTAPRTATDYAYFHVSSIATADGSLPVGRLTVGTGHAGPREGVHAATEHYDHTGATWAYVRAGEDKHGIWVAGQVHPHATEAQIADGASAPLSGDWRRVGGNLELVAALGVVSGGFPVPRGARDEVGADYSLVAAGALQKDEGRTVLSQDEIQRIGRVLMDEMAADDRRKEAEKIAGRMRVHQAAALSTRVNGAR